ncbi:acyl-CoA dehydrogenase [Pseudomonas aeruginosa]|uniref:acyl-CoA dehydrogenase family protein n=1 Tax=Pseudomonas aeruginosa group TaxID=136841 RepID=UPI0005B77B6D|nr:MULTISPECIES: acyl-CoA dehydrogenase family protein [Pseudomonas aeruginosa group]KSP92492.1 acyl-CoA dehydrogenase [Pseudomonas aeruginosa]MBG7007772.1 acyl-CoA/acyl-ACP dehydrogenase [Pseudomonas aeruginosa]MBG7027195.1 acyl-CoA/acyl-ACP dehydrogenase [Pseudomonas aeruginosa]MBG7372733.1 acyl-CoA/acyl-ACP dehydrogenase [Pseudomonas aeruginosa]MCW8021421.1 acyl-CoA/acyl-ACP dehydrogenase [Pseudomonas aeruginosa]
MKVNLPSQEQKLAVESFRKYLEAEVRPVVREFRDQHIPKARMRELTQGIAEFGLPGVSVAEEHGGLGLSLVTEAMLFEELCAVSVDVGLCVMINKGMAVTLAELPPSQAHLRERYLADIMAGRTFGGFCISEPDVGSNVIDIKATGKRDGDSFIINGEKTWISNGHYSDFLITTVRTGPNELSHILVDREEHGYQSANIDKIALNGQSTAQVFFDQVRVPARNVVWEEGSGLKNTMKLFEKARANVGMLSVGLMRAALEASIRYSQERHQFGKPIAAHQLVAAKIAEMATLLDAARLMCFRAFSMMDEGVRCDVQSSMSKWFATEMAVKVCRDAVQLHGGNGLTKEFDVERLAREAIVIPIPDGTTEIQKLMISRALTGISAFV